MSNDDNLVRIESFNETYIRVICEPFIAYEISDYFTFPVPEAKFMPSFKNKVWDGKIRLYNRMTQLLYAGLLPYVEKFCKDREYSFEYSLLPLVDFTNVDALNYIKSLNLPSDIEIRPYQVEALAYGIRNSRALFLSPTSSGKSLIIYSLMRYLNKKTLIVVPTTALVHQLASDFGSYGLPDADDHIHKIFTGQEKNTDKLITISTWQSIYKKPKSFFANFDVVFGDEAHQFKANSLISIMTKMESTKYRFGLTGTLDGMLTNKLVLEGLFGAVSVTTTMSEMMDEGYASRLKAKCIVLKYSDEDRKMISKSDYQAEMDFLISNEKRNKFIRNLALSLKGNTLVLFRLVEDHGKVLYDMIQTKAPEREVYFIHGGIDGQIRNDIREKIEESENAIIVASYGTFSTGINIKNLHNIVFASPTKSRIRTLQSVGRVLRKSKTKDKAVLYDIADDLSWKSKANHTIRHFMERIKIYNEENFDYKTYSLEIE
jgi:superfamily II DNA or RNA helicase